VKKIPHQLQIGAQRSSVQSIQPHPRTMKKTLLAILGLAAVSLAGVNGQTIITSWNFFGQNSTTNPTTSDPYLVAPNLASSTLSRGAGAAASVGNNSFRTTGFGNSTLSITSNRYFEFTLTPSGGFLTSVSALNANMQGTSTFFASPGTQNQFAYSTNGVDFTAIGSPVVRTAAGYLGSIDTSGITELQNFTSAVTFRFFAVGQTNTGGWGFTSANATAAADGLIVTGSVNVVPEPTTWALIGLGTAFVLLRMRRRRAVG
jgi:hypothetical protein